MKKELLTLAGIVAGVAVFIWKPQLSVILLAGAFFAFLLFAAIYGTFKNK